MNNTLNASLFDWGSISGSMKPHALRFNATSAQTCVYPDCIYTNIVITNLQNMWGDETIIVLFIQNTNILDK